MQSVVLIPSLNPDEKLIRLLEGLHELDIRDILLVDDGSKPETKHYFEQARQMGCRVVTHAVNLGKGRALKTGFNAFLNLFPDRPGVVMADADGQHSPQDILKVGRAMEAQPG
ncbi:MAG: glycosyltransferase, partial [Acutalibacteraceae bacterium]